MSGRRSDPHDKPLAAPSSPNHPPCLSESLSLECPRPSSCRRLCACAALTPNKAGGPPLPPYRRVRILPPSLRHPGDWSVNSWPGGRVRRAAKRQAAPRPLLKEKHCQVRLFAQYLNGTWERRWLTPSFRPYHRVGETWSGSLRCVLPTFSPSVDLARPLASVKRISRRPIFSASWSEACGNYATQRAAGAAPGMRGGGVPAGPPPLRCPRAASRLRLQPSGSRGTRGLIAEVGGTPAAPAFSFSFNLLTF